MATSSLSSLFRKASSLLGLSAESPGRQHPPLDGEIVYCKNNVCVHPPARLSAEVEHHPGYLNIRSQHDELLGHTLILTWIPNSSLKKNPRSIENSPIHPLVSPHRRSPRQEFAHSSWSPTQSPLAGGGDEAHHPEEEHKVAAARGRRDSGQGSSGSPGSSSSGGDGSAEAGGGQLSASLRSQSDSGIGAEDCEGLSNNGAVRAAVAASTAAAAAKVGCAANEPRKRTVAGEGDVDSPSSESEAGLPTEAQLQCLLGQQRRAKHPEEARIMGEARKQRTSSNRSITSIEMEGDNLVVVTEEVDDATFLDDDDDEGQQGAPLVCRGKELRRDDDTSPEDSASLSSDSTYPSPTGDHYHRMLEALSGQRCGPGARHPDMDRLKDSLALQLDLQGMHPDHVMDRKLNKQCLEEFGADDDPAATLQTQSPGAQSSSSTATTSGPDSTPATPARSLGSLSPPDDSPMGGSPVATGAEPASPTGVSYNMTFPENSVTYGRQQEQQQAGHRTAKEQMCGVFSVDLGQMRSLRIFYSNDSCTSGQLVIASRESQYKILHFHHEGLDRLSDTLDDWKFLAQARDKINASRKAADPAVAASDVKQRKYTVIRPFRPNDLVHPEEGAHAPVTAETWRQHMDASGAIHDDFQLRKVIFFAGLDRGLRPEMWPFLLHYYPYRSTHEAREALRNDKYIEYQNLRAQREALSGEAAERFYRTVQCTVEKDVVRTDRSHPYFRGEDNPNIDVLKNILLNYAVAHPHYGYTQGMSDLLAPVLAEVQHEADAYWCFVGLMQNTIFVSSPKDVDMDTQLLYLRELTRLCVPRFYAHLAAVPDGLELLFVHRWILLCFKREFPEEAALRIWEACWAHYQTDYFHLFVCVAILAVYGEDVVQQSLPADEMLLHFSSLAMHMDGDVILKKARGLLHKFRIRKKIPCTLVGLCRLCSAGMWDSGHVPAVRCVGDHPEGATAACPYGGKVEK